MSSNAELERFWSGMKARAIARPCALHRLASPCASLCSEHFSGPGRECREFYSQYDGQSWKNVISIGALAAAASSRRDPCWCSGDSDFERLGTMLATKASTAEHFLWLRRSISHVLHVRFHFWLHIRTTWIRPASNVPTTATIVRWQPSCDSFQLKVAPAMKCKGSVGNARGSIGHWTNVRLLQSEAEHSTTRALWNRRRCDTEHRTCA